MMHSKYLHSAIISAAIWPSAFATGLFLKQIRASCADGYSLCAPPGATSTATPQIGSAQFEDLFADIVLSSLPESNARSVSARSPASLCCISSLSCLTMANLAIPFCYDRFTTNFFLPDGSYGTVVGGAYTSSNRDIANLETGDYVLANGHTGNIYSANEAAKPNTATLPIPTQFTASGIGSAIPASALGGEITVMTVPATTESIISSIIPAVVISGHALLPVTISTGSTVKSTVAVPTTAISTVPARTIPGTTIPATVTAATVVTITTTEAGRSTATAGETKGAAAGAQLPHTVTVGFLAILLGVFGSGY